MKNIVITGFMGTGKSSVGRMVAEKLGRRFVDMDEAIEARAGIAVAEIFAEQGELAFRDLEADLARDLGNHNDLVIATGGGTLLREANRESLSRQGIVVCLTAAPEAVLARIAEDGLRPLLANQDPAVRLERIAALLRERAPVYDSVKIQIDTSGRSVAEVALLVIQACRDEECKSSASN